MEGLSREDLRRKFSLPFPPNHLGYSQDGGKARSDSWERELWMEAEEGVGQERKYECRNLHTPSFPWNMGSSHNPAGGWDIRQGWLASAPTLTCKRWAYLAGWHIWAEPYTGCDLGSPGLGLSPALCGHRYIHSPTLCSIDRSTKWARHLDRKSRAAPRSANPRMA